MNDDGQKVDLVLGETNCIHCGLEFSVSLVDVDKGFVEGLVCQRCKKNIPVECLDIPGIKYIVDQLLASSSGGQSISGRTLIRVGFKRTIEHPYLESWGEVPKRIIAVLARPVYSPTTFTTMFYGNGTGEINYLALGDGDDDDGTEGKALSEGELPIINVVNVRLEKDDLFAKILFDVISSWPDPYPRDDWPSRDSGMGKREFQDYVLGKDWYKNVPSGKHGEYMQEKFKEYSENRVAELRQFVLVEWQIWYLTEEAEKRLDGISWLVIHFEAVRKRITEEYLLATLLSAIAMENYVKARISNYCAGKFSEAHKRDQAMIKYNKKKFLKRLSRVMEEVTGKALDKQEIELYKECEGLYKYRNDLLHNLMKGKYDLMSRTREQAFFDFRTVHKMIEFFEGNRVPLRWQYNHYSDSKAEHLVK
ncbi:MAG: hypothetical protein KJ621_06210 [Proteobacteria bacterium]|nr:hypothetical protein [Pseudomonadota bacterium]MBU1742951.1 hypothetical protein [Pseudomonadota bacterium]